MTIFPRYQNLYQKLSLATDTHALTQTKTKWVRILKHESIYFGSWRREIAERPIFYPVALKALFTSKMAPPAL